MAEPVITNEKGGVVFNVKVVPGSSRTMLAGTLGDKIKIKVASAAEKGKANACLTDFLAKKLGVRKQAVTIVSGKTSPVKQIRIEGVDSQKTSAILFGGKGK